MSYEPFPFELEYQAKQRKLRAAVEARHVKHVARHQNRTSKRAPLYPFERTYGAPAVPGTAVKLLSNPSKMPGYSFGLPAGRSCPGAVYGENSICGSCYAQKGMYAFSKNVAIAQQARYDWTLRSLMTADGRATWVTVMTAAVTWATRKEPFFRIHDSGDMFSPQYVNMWAEVARNLPEVHFWAPTRSYHYGNARILVALQNLASLPNVAIRPSALHINVEAPVVDGLQAGSGVKVDGWNCPASTQGNVCGSCRACWTEKSTPIYYHLH